MTKCVDCLYYNEDKETGFGTCTCTKFEDMPCEVGNEVIEDGKLTIITHVKDTKEVILETVLDMVDVDDDDEVNSEIIEYMAAVYGAKEISLIDNPQYQKYQDYNGMFFRNKDNYFEVTFDIDNRNNCHVFVGNF